MRVRLIRILAVLLLFAVLAAAALRYFLNRPFARFQREAFVEIPKGASTPEIAALLAEAGVIEYPWELLLNRAWRQSAKLQAGEYRFAAPASALAGYNRIVPGDVYYRE